MNSIRLLSAISRVSNRHSQHRNVFCALRCTRLQGLQTSCQTYKIFNVQDDADFQIRVLENKKPVIVDFHADWCGPCKTLGPRLEAVMEKEGDSVDMAKVDVDQFQDLSMTYSINAVPTVIAFKDGKKKDQFSGVQATDQIEDFVTKLKHA